VQRGIKATNIVTIYTGINDICEWRSREHMIVNSIPLPNDWNRPCLRLPKVLEKLSQ
jgi:hypothetical protein